VAERQTAAETTKVTAMCVALCDDVQADAMHAFVYNSPGPTTRLGVG